LSGIPDAVRLGIGPFEPREHFPITLVRRLALARFSRRSSLVASTARQKNAIRSQSRTITVTNGVKRRSGNE